jgi:AcrR family transcriptional regulator
MTQTIAGLDTTSTKYKILETALELFSRKGYSAVSVREITKAVGIKESALYNHFKSKDEILDFIYQMFITIRSENLPSDEQIVGMAKALDIKDFLMSGIDLFKKSVDSELQERIWRILNIEQFRDERARAIILEYMYKGTIDFLEKVFQAFMNEQKLPVQNARLLAIHYQYPIFTMMTEYLLLKYDNKDTSEVETTMHQHLNWFITSNNL